MKKSATAFAVLALLVSAPAASAQAQPRKAPIGTGRKSNPGRGNRALISAREPRGIYVVYLDTANRPPYTGIIDNPAVSGLYLYFHWATLEPREGQFDFSLLDAAFQAAESKHKTIQFALVPGFWTPSWLLDELPSCDGWLASPAGKPSPESPQCGKATFGLNEGAALKGQMHELPLPWNAVYKKAWQTFLGEFARRYGQREAFVSIAITGPTSQSEETVLPYKGPGETEKWARLLEAFYTDPSYHRSNKAFIEEWEAAIDDYGKIFSNVTLTLVRAGGFAFNPPRKPEAAAIEIAAYFASKPLGSNAKATQNNGITAAHSQTMREVKKMAADANLNPRVLGGGEFDTGFSRDPAREGCLSNDVTSPACKSTTPEQAFANVLGVFFAGTPYGHLYGSQDGPAPLQYLEIYNGDILYANSHPPVQAKLLEASTRFVHSN
jgi:hypothetical protein